MGSVIRRVVEEEVVIEERVLLPPEPPLARAAADRAPAHEEQDGDVRGLPTLLPFVPSPHKTTRSGAARYSSFIRAGRGVPSCFLGEPSPVVLR